MSRPTVWQMWYAASSLTPGVIMATEYETATDKTERLGTAAMDGDPVASKPARRYAGR